MREHLQKLMVVGIAVFKRHSPARSLQHGLIAALMFQISVAEFAIGNPIKLHIDPSRSNISLSNDPWGWLPLVEGGLTASVSGDITAEIDDALHLFLPDLGSPDDLYGSLNRVDLSKREVPGYPGPASYYVSTTGGLWDVADIGFYLFGDEWLLQGFSDVTPNSSRSFPFRVDYYVYSLRYGGAYINPGSNNGIADVTYSLSGSQVEVLLSFHTTPNPSHPFGLNGEIVATAIVPEPSSLMLALMAGTSIFLRRQRRRSKSV